MPRIAALIVAVAAAVSSCSNGTPDGSASQAPARPSILLVTLDTTRADGIGPEAQGIETPSFNALAARGRRFRQAYAAVPETLPSHSSIMTGLYPAGHGIHENARFLDSRHPVIAERLKAAGYRTAAFVSSFVLSRRFGLQRGFDVFDDEPQQGASERSALDTTARAIASLPGSAPLFMWVHYFDPHAPYTPPEPFRSRYSSSPYLGEVAAMDQQLGRLVQAFESTAPGPSAIVVAADHGEGLGDHGEMQHGNLLYQSTMHVPLVMVGPGVTPGTIDTPVSTRRIFHTVLDWAGIDAALSLRGTEQEVVLGEAMKPFLEYGWQPQTMAVAGQFKGIQAGTLETYDLATDSKESKNLGAGTNLPPGMRKALDDYPIPSVTAARTPENLDEDARRRLASLGYIGATAPPVIRRDAPRPADMVRLFDVIDQASGLFVQERYADAIPLFERILADDRNNLDATLRLATSHSLLGHEQQALDAFRRASRIAPQSTDVRTYLALHYARGRGWQQAAPLLEQVLAEAPERLVAIDALAAIREREGNRAAALALRQKARTLRPFSAAELIRLGDLAMSLEQTAAAIDAFEAARAINAAGFERNLELGVLYLSDRRLESARTALDRVPPSDRGYPMALFKRAQVSVLLNEPDKASRIEAARRHADNTTRELISRERLFR
jgi:arylsulfatase A-like enzyme/tetratricopeptide (TPR) repeat protein